eukprot:scaffold13489_cov48-Attheya_sp.AAC.1
MSNNETINNRPVLVTLLPFEVSLRLLEPSLVNYYALTSTMETYLGEFFMEELSEKSILYMPFDRVVLDFVETRRLLFEYAISRKLQSLEVQAKYEGYTIFTRDGGLPHPNTNVVAAMQINAMEDREGDLLEALQFITEDLLTSNTVGENEVTSVKAAINFNGGRNDNINDNPDLGTPNNDGNNSLNTVIIIAVVVACLASLLLGAALFLAWQRKKRSESAFKIGSPTNGSGKNSISNVPKEEDLSESQEQARASATPRSHGGASRYPESVISEDISTSLSAYHKAGMGPAGGKRSRGRDDASVSSMESYGYSLDGYASSIAPSTQYGY